MQIANYMGSPNFHAHVDSTLYQSIGLVENGKAYSQRWQEAKSQEFAKMQYVQACDFEADAKDDDHYLWSIKHMLQQRERTEAWN